MRVCGREFAMYFGSVVGGGGFFLSAFCGTPTRSVTGMTAPACMCSALCSMCCSMCARAFSAAVLLCSSGVSSGRAGAAHCVLGSTVWWVVVSCAACCCIMCPYHSVRVALDCAEGTRLVPYEKRKGCNKELYIYIYKKETMRFGLYSCISCIKKKCADFVRRGGGFCPENRQVIHALIQQP